MIGMQAGTDLALIVPPVHPDAQSMHDSFDTMFQGG